MCFAIFVFFKLNKLNFVAYKKEILLTQFLALMEAASRTFFSADTAYSRKKLLISKRFL
ncbi:hypothetical protein BC624_10481 [Flavobacterium granuli]|uniref:Uncharacterized protein n=1 Tax=Flavobacterium granuli TaxID=280093 RepID=A0A1M5LGJ2_9FLAO|nr:hypothetical protein BC624_10481 [Flavobacterium granuli]SHG64085.1 hypothetical protein SAMN05443373_10381 [Flavobacterium granuli]